MNKSCLSVHWCICYPIMPRQRLIFLQSFGRFLKGRVTWKYAPCAPLLKDFDRLTICNDVMATSENDRVWCRQKTKSVCMLFSIDVSNLSPGCAWNALAKHNPPSGYTNRHNWWHPPRGVCWSTDKCGIMSYPGMHSYFYVPKMHPAHINLAFKWTYVMRLKQTPTRLTHFVIFVHQSIKIRHTDSLPQASDSDFRLIYVTLGELWHNDYISWGAKLSDYVIILTHGR